MAEHHPFEEFEKLGEEGVRRKLASMEWQGVHANAARIWLDGRATMRRKIWHESWWGKLLLDAIRYTSSALAGYLFAAFQHKNWPFG